MGGEKLGVLPDRVLIKAGLGWEVRSRHSSFLGAAGILGLPPAIGLVWL